MPHCCTWLDFISSVRRHWDPAWGEIDGKKARQAWGTHCATPGEFLRHEEAQYHHREAQRLASQTTGEQK